MKVPCNKLLMIIINCVTKCFCNQFDSALQEFMKKRAEDEEMSSRLEQNLLLANRVLMQEKDQLAKQNEVHFRDLHGCSHFSIASSFIF